MAAVSTMYAAHAVAAATTSRSPVRCWIMTKESSGLLVRHAQPTHAHKAPNQTRAPCRRRSTKYSKIGVKTTDNWSRNAAFAADVLFMPSNRNSFEATSAAAKPRDTDQGGAAPSRCERK